MTKLVSIILPTFNSENYIKNTLDSIFKQTYKNYEIIIVDDCSKDKTVSIIRNINKKKIKKIKLIQTKQNSKTAAIPRNLGLKYAKGDVICFIDSDDIWHENKLEIQLKNFNDKKTIIASKAKYFSSNYESSFLLNFFRGLIQNFIIKKINNQGYHWFYLYNPIILSSVLIHQSVLKKLRFDENIDFREDLDLWIRQRQKNYKFLIIDEILVKIRRRADSFSSSSKKELIIILRSLLNTFFKFRTYEKLNFFLIGIIVKFSLAFIKYNASKIKKVLKNSSFAIVFLYFLIFYTPFFWYLGNSLLYHDNMKSISNVKNIMIYSGHGSTSIYGITYLNRYQDVKNIIKKNGNVENIFIIGELNEIPQQKILEELFNKNKNIKNVEIIYKDYDHKKDFIDFFSNFLKEKNIKEIIITTSPYHTKRAKLQWSKIDNFNFYLWKSSNWPEKNRLFQYALNKKIILYENYKVLIETFF